MTAILIAALTALAVISAGIAWHMAATLAVAQRLIAVQRRGIALREQAIEQQQQRLNWYVERTGDLEDRNAMLERVQRRNLHSAVVSLPVLDGTRVLERVTEISLN